MFSQHTRREPRNLFFKKHQQMKNFLLVFSLLLCFCCKESGVKIERPSTFVHYFNGGTPDVAQSIIKTSDGGYLILANSQTTLTSSFYRIKLIKVDAYGNESWERLIPKVFDPYDPNAVNAPTPSSYRGYGITAITDNQGTDIGYFIVGEQIYNDSTNKGNRTQGLLMIQVEPTKGAVTDSVLKTRADLGVSVRGVGVTKAKNGNYYVLGQVFPSPTDLPNDMYLAEIKSTSKTFDPVWSRTYGAAQTTLVNQVFTNGDSIYWGGTRTGTSSQMRWLGSQINSGVRSESAYPAGQALSDGGVPINFSCSDICTYGFGYGFVGSYSLSSGVYNRIAFFRVNGKTVDTISYHLDFPLNPPFQAAGNSVCSTRDGGFLILGTAPTDVANSNTNYLLIKTDAYGGQVWSKQYGGNFVDIGSKVMQTDDGGFIVLGTTTLGNVESVFLMKTDSEGNIQ